MSGAARTSLLFGRARQFLARNKSTFVYDADKTFGQRWVEKRTNKLKELQKFHAAEDGTPLWWKSSADKAMTTVAFAGTIACFVISLSNLVKFAQGKL